VRRIGAVVVAALSLVAGSGCSIGKGEGRVYSKDLYAHDCWGVGDASKDESRYDMRPDFFAAIPYRNTMMIRVQNGNDLTEVSDGLTVMISDVEEIRKNRLGKPLRVSLPPGVRPPGSPAEPPPDLIADPPLVHMALYLERSCHNQNVILYAVDGTITFDKLFSGDPNEKSAEEKLTTAKSFAVMMGDPRDAPLGHYAVDIPDDKQSLVEGEFNFYFERGQPAQPFP
jgi:hypothetical protein